MKRLFFILFSLLVIACAEKVNVEKNIIANIPKERPIVAPNVKPAREAFTKQVEIKFKNNNASLSPLPDGVVADVRGADVVVRSWVAGVEYVVSGESRNASLVVVSEKSPLVTFDSLSIHSVGKDAVSISSKEMVYVSGGKAFLSDEPSAQGVVEKRASLLTLMGDAVLCGGVEINLQSARRDALSVTGILYVDSATLVVDNAVGSAINVVKGAVVAQGNVSAAATKDVIKVKQGNFVMLDGEVALSATADKADALVARNIYLFGGELLADVKGAAAKGLKSKESQFLVGGSLNVYTSGGALFSEKKGDYSSSSCVKSSGNVYIGSANVSLVSEGAAGKGINCDGLLQIDGGALSVKTAGNDVNHPIDLNAHASAKGVKCDSAILVKGGDIKIIVSGRGERCEGLESKGNITITGEDTRVYISAWDDAINARDLYIEGGKIYASSLANDGIDSNGKIDIKGGLVVANGTHSPELGIDVDDAKWFTVTGGTIISMGGSMGPAPSLPLGDATKGFFVAWTGFAVEAGKYVSLVDADGATLFSYRLPRSLPDATLMIASPLLSDGENYSLFVSDGIEGGSSVGCGLYYSADIISATQQIDWAQNTPYIIINREGVAEPFNVDDAKRRMPPPPMDGISPMGPPPAGFNFPMNREAADPEFIMVEGW